MTHTHTRACIAGEIDRDCPCEATPTVGRCTCVGTVPVFRAYHEPECPDATNYDKQMWAQAVLNDPARASVEASGMATADLNVMRRAFDA